MLVLADFCKTNQMLSFPLEAIMSDQQPSTLGTAGTAASTASVVTSSGGSSTPTQCTITSGTSGNSQMPVVTATAATTSQQQVRVSFHCHCYSCLHNAMYWMSLIRIYSV